MGSVFPISPLGITLLLLRGGGEDPLSCNDRHTLKLINFKECSRYSWRFVNLHKQAANHKRLACKLWTTQKVFYSQTQYSFSQLTLRTWCILLWDLPCMHTNTHASTREASSHLPSWCWDQGPSPLLGQLGYLVLSGVRALATSSERSWFCEMLFR